MTSRRTDLERTSRRLRPEWFSALTALTAVFAPVSLTGHPVIDAVERAVVTAFVSYVGAHGRRWAWLGGAAAVVVSARGASLVLALVALAIVTAAAVPKRRPRSWGALGLGIMVNAVFWYPPSTPAWGAAVAFVALVLVVGSGLPFLRPSKRKAARGVLVAMAVLLLVAGVAAGVAMVLAYGNVRSGATAARDALEGARDGDAEGARADLASANEDFSSASDRVNGLLTVPAMAVPGLAQQVTAVQTTVDQGRRISGTADDLVATADYDTLTYDGRLDLDQVRSLAEPTARADAALRDARAELLGFDGARLLPPLRDRIDQFAVDIDEARTDTALAADLLEVTPGLFGADETRKYLIVFITPAELRGAGGFIGSYAELTIEDGDATLSRSGRIRELVFGPNQGARVITGEDDYLRRYGRFSPADFVQDATYSPDFPTTGSVLSQIYPQAGGTDIDGVIAVDPTGLAALLELTGPVQVAGLSEPLTADNAVEVLTRSQYIDVPDDDEREDILTEAVKVTFERLTESQLPAPRTIANTLSPAVRAGHLRLWSPDPAEQALFEQLGASGDLVIPQGADGFSVVQQNSGNNKLDAYLQRHITYLPTVDYDTGKLTAQLTIELRNEVPSVDLPPAVVGNSRGLPVGTNLAAVSVFTRNVVTSAQIDGKPVTLGPGSEKGLNAWDAPLVQIPPGGKVTITMQLEGGVDLSKGYRLQILPQPVANPDRFTATLKVDNGAVTSTGTPQKTIFEDEPIDTPTAVRIPLEP